MGFGSQLVSLFRTIDGGNTWTEIINPYESEDLQSCRKTGMSFSGTGTLTADIGGSSLTYNINISGTVDPGGEIDGTFTFTLLIDGSFDSSGDGTFTGQVTGNTLSVDFSGQDIVGDTCTFTGSLSGTS